MAESGSPSNVLARRVIDEIVDCFGESKTSKYMKAFIFQEISECRRLVKVLRQEVDVVRVALGQDRSMIAEMEAVNDLFEYVGSLGCLRDNKRILGRKMLGLNKRIEDTEGEIRPYEGHLDVMDIEDDLDE